MHEQAVCTRPSFHIQGLGTRLCIYVVGTHASICKTTSSSLSMGEWTGEGARFGVVETDSLSLGSMSSINECTIPSRVERLALLASSQTVNNC